MRRHIAIASALVGIFVAASPANAGTIFVSPTGSDPGACGTPSAPCATLQRAHTRVDPGGTILLIDPGNYGSATITKSVSIRGVQGAGVFSPPTAPCLTFNGGPSDVLTVSVFDCDMDGAPNDGILFNSGEKVRLENSVIRGATGAKCGLRAAPSTGTSEVMINNTTLSENGTTGTNNGGGICLLPTGTAQLSGVIRNSMFQNDRHGFVLAPSGSATGALLIDGSDASNNAGGIFSVGANSTVCIRNSTISGNTFMGLGGGGILLNGGGNTVWHNAANGAFSGNCP